jgi:hypothetical protein
VVAESSSKESETSVSVQFVDKLISESGPVEKDESGCRVSLDASSAVFKTEENDQEELKPKLPSEELHGCTQVSQDAKISWGRYSENTLNSP